MSNEVQANQPKGYVFLHGYNEVEQETIRRALHSYLPASLPTGHNYWLLYKFGNGALDKTPTYVARRLRWMWYQAIEAASAAELAEKLDFYYDSLDVEAQADKQMKEAEERQQQHETA